MTTRTYILDKLHPLAPQLHPLRIPLHWDTELTCGTCVFRQSGVLKDGKIDQHAKCMRPIEQGGQQIHPYADRDNVPTTWPACIAHKEQP